MGFVEDEELSTHWDQTAAATGTYDYNNQNLLNPSL